MSLIVIQGDATFTTAQPLVGSGILVVFGNLTIPAGSNFNGVIYVDRELLAVRAVAGQRRGRRHGSITMIGRLGHHRGRLGRDRSSSRCRNTLGGYRFSRTEYVIP